MWRTCLRVWHVVSVWEVLAAAPCIRLALWTPDQLFCKLSSPGWTNLPPALGLGVLGTGRGVGLAEFLLPL